MIRRQHTVAEFFEEAEVMREALDVHFKDAYSHSINWHYFCDPQKYTYLRAAPQGAFPAAVFDRFMQRLRAWCLQSLGLMPIGDPSLHLMVNGCRLGLHSDFHNGTWGYVYSLTRWEDRKFSGGETLLLRDGVPSYKKHHVHGEVLYELIPANFNQLLVFDDRVVHGTPAIEGSMDPLDGRIALVGHIRATSPIVSGELPSVDARRVVSEALPRIRSLIGNYKDVQGTITYRLNVEETGIVESVTTLTDNVVTPVTGYAPSDSVVAVKSIIQRTVAGLKFPPRGGKSVVVVPILIPLPDLQRIDLAVPHNLPVDEFCEWTKVHLSKDLELQGDWSEHAYIVREPIGGSVRIDPRQIAFSFDPPMWVPSQRQHFEASLTRWAAAAVAGAGARY